MFGLMLRSTHEAAIKDAEAECASIWNTYALAQNGMDAALKDARTKGRLAAELLAERDEARAEVAALKGQLAHPMAARPRDAKGHFLKVNGSAPATS